MRQITKRGMTFAWSFSNALIHIELSAPTDGWLAVGFNDKNQLVGTNLIMGALYSSGELIIQEQVILRVGKHRAKVDLDLIDRLSHRSGCPDGKNTTLSFSLPTTPTDKYSYCLSSGQPIHLLLAYSRAREFEHHSRMRTHVRLTL